MLRTIKTTDFQMTKDVSEYLDSKLNTLDKYIPRDDESIKCDVEIGRSTGHHQTGNVFKVEINIAIGKKVLRAETEQETIFAAIDAAKDEIAARLRKDKDRNLRLFKKGSEAIKNFLRFGRRGR